MYFLLCTHLNCSKLGITCALADPLSLKLFLTCFLQVNIKNVTKMTKIPLGISKYFNYSKFPFIILTKTIGSGINWIGQANLKNVRLRGEIERWDWAILVLMTLFSNLLSKLNAFNQNNNPICTLRMYWNKELIKIPNIPNLPFWVIFHF